MLKRLFKAARKVWRSSITGKFVTKAFAKAHPETTQEETVE